MQVTEVDERDSCWEVEEPRFRVYVFEGQSNATSCYDISGAEVLEVVRWAQDRCGDDERYAVAVVHDQPAFDGSVDRGLVWLLGLDANTSASDPRTVERLAAMDGRRGRRVVVDQ